MAGLLPGWTLSHAALPTVGAGFGIQRVYCPASACGLGKDGNVAAASIWVDADACPNVIKEILFRAAERTGVAVTLVANQPLQIPRIPSLRAIQVSSGFDVADGEIVKRVAAGDLVITADIPLAAEVIAKGGEALNPRGERYSPDTIRGVLAMRDFMDTMRSSGNVGGGPPPLTQANRNAFAGHLDTWLARRQGV
jgi:uncharacterized protein